MQSIHKFPFPMTKLSNFMFSVRPNSLHGLFTHRPIIPFVFVLQPELLMIGSAPAIIAALLTTTVGVVLIAAAFAGHLVAPLAAPRRWLLALSGLCLIPSPAASEVILAVNAAGLAIAAVVLIPLVLRRRAARAEQP